MGCRGAVERARTIVGIVAGASVGWLASSVCAQPFQALGVDLMSHIPLSGFGNPAPNSGSACVGYVSPSGREYAVMGLNDRTAYVEITNPAAPVLLATIPHPASSWNEMKTFSTYAYIANETGGGLQVVNLANIDSGSVSLVTSITDNGLTTSHTVTVNAASSHLYLNGSNVTGSGGSLVAFSLANPANPTFAGMWNGPYVHDSQVVSYTTGPLAGREIAYCYCGGDGFFIVDVTNKSNMFTVSQLAYPALAYCHQGWLSNDRRYVYMNDELDGPNQGVPSGLTRVIDVLDINNPVLASTFSSAVPGAIDHNNFIRGRYLFQSNYTSGLRVFDLGVSATNPPEVAWIDTYPETNAASFNGTWHNDPFFPSGTIIISDIQRGLFVVRLNLDYLTFSFPDGLPSQIAPQRATSVVASVTSNGTAVNPSTVTLHAAIGAGAYVPTPMFPLGGDRYVADLPAAPCASTVRYYFSASNTAGRSFASPLNAPTSGNYSALAISGTTTVLTYDMEADAGWTAGAGDDTATSGVWQRGDPQATAAQPGDDVTPGAGVNCWATGLQAGPGVGAFDVDNGKTTLFSPTINLLGADPLTRISYWRWYSNNAGAAPNQDTFRVDLSNNGGTSWTNAETVGPSGLGTGGGWMYHEFQVSGVLPLTGLMRLRFVAEDAAPGSVVEAAIDELRVFTYRCDPPCNPDFNDDGSVDNSDVIDLADCVSTGGSGCDFNNDGSADNADIFDLADVVSGGPCP